MSISNDEYIRFKIDKLYDFLPVHQPIILVHATEALAKDNFEKIKAQLESGVIEFKGKFKMNESGRSRYWMQRWRHKFGKIDRKRKRKTQKANKKARKRNTLIILDEFSGVSQETINWLNKKCMDDLKNMLMGGLGNDVTKPSRQMFESTSRLRGGRR